MGTIGTKDASVRPCTSLHSLLTVSMPSSDEGHLKMRYGSANRNCPIRGKTTKKGLVRPQQCDELKGKSRWVTSWQRCGAECTKNRYCMVWTYRSGFCQLYRNAKARCGITQYDYGAISGYSGCQA